MPARIVAVLDTPEASEKTAAILRDQGQDAIALPDSMVALDALELAERLELLVTCLHHPTGKPNGIALARMAKIRRLHIKMLFIGPPEMAHHSEGLGRYFASPTARPEQIAAAALEMLEAE